jgi:hyperosmotically inducible protein
VRKIIVLVVLVLIAGGGYYAYKSGWSIPSWLGADAATTAKVKAALALSKRVSAYEVGVDTREGVVTLTGQVPSESVKSLAGEIARDVAGVKEIKNDIVVNPGAEPSAENERVEDLEIKAAILEAFTRSPELEAKHVEVAVDRRTVTLSGAVNTQAQRNGAEQAARAIQGVASVVNNLTVNNPEAETEPARASNKDVRDPNAELADRVSFELFRTNAFDMRRLTVRADSGTVTLSGTVRSRAEQLLAERLAQVVEGVKKVANELQVERKGARDGAAS